METRALRRTEVTEEDLEPKEIVLNQELASAVGNDDLYCIPGRELFTRAHHAADIDL